MWPDTISTMRKPSRTEVVARMLVGIVLWIAAGAVIVWALGKV